MCGRIALTLSESELADLFGATANLHLSPRYNLAPSQSIPVVRSTRAGVRELVLMRWGLVPRWSSETNPAGFINARSETATTKPAFRDAFRRRRCLVPADGFYEWKTFGKKVRQPYFFRKAGGGPLVYAGIWETWNGPAGPVDTLAVLTTSANDLVRPLHDRMPAIMPEDRFALWLDSKETRAEMLLPLLAPYPAERMESWPVSQRVNSATIEEPNLNAPVDPGVVISAPRGLFDDVPDSPRLDCTNP